MSITQRCSKCGRLIPVSEYSEDGFKRQVCKECEQAEQEAAKPKTKVCECCGRELPIESFFKSKRYKDRYYPKCKECETFLKSDVEPKFKTCRKCGKTLPTYLFYKSKDTKEKLSSWCKACSKKGAAASKERNRNTPHPPIDSKICTRCGRFLPIEEFAKNKSTRDGYDTWCKDCKNETRTLRDQKQRMQKLIPGWTAPTQEDDDRSVDNIATPPPPQRAVAPTPPKVEQEQTTPTPEEFASPPSSIVEERSKPAPTFSTTMYVPIRFKAGDTAIRLKDGIFFLEQLSGKVQVNTLERLEILYETIDGDMVADKELFKNEREALERTKLAYIIEGRKADGDTSGETTISVEDGNPLDLLTINEAAALLKVSRTTLFRYDQAGYLHPIKVGTAKRYRRADLLKLIQSVC